MVHPIPHAAGSRSDAGQAAFMTDHGMSGPDVSARSLELELPADAASVGAGRHAVREFCDGHSLDHATIAIAVSEALTNVVVHAYRGTGGNGPMRISASMLADMLVVVVSDDGQGMTPRSDSPGLGLGMLLIARLASAMEVDSDHGGTRLEMRFGGNGRGSTLAGTRRTRSSRPPFSRHLHRSGGPAGPSPSPGNAGAALGAPGAQYRPFSRMGI